jgi:hypothetical protein
MSADSAHQATPAILPVSTTHVMTVDEFVQRVASVIGATRGAGIARTLRYP